MNNQKKFFQTLFDADDMVCLAPTAYDTALFNIKSIHFTNAQYFTINALHTSRADANVTKHRTLLMEIDNMPLHAQDDAVKGLPITAKVFSGNKSFHYFICLEEPTTAEQYASLWRRLQAAVPAIDKACKNPSRLARTPDATRPDTRTVQELVFLNKRVPNIVLEAALPAEEKASATEDGAKSNKLWISAAVMHAVRMPDETMNEIHFDGRNNFFFWLGQRLIEAGRTREERKELIKQAYANLRNKEKFSLREALMAGRVK